MAFLPYVPPERIPEDCAVADDDHILRIDGVHPRVMRQHFDLYVELMRRPGPLTRREREMTAVVVSARNRCHY